MRMSMSTTSGRRRRTMFTAASPSGASPTTRMSGSLSRITRKPVRSSRWSSAITTVISPPAAGSGAGAPAPRRRGAPAHLGHRHALGHARQPQRPGRVDQARRRAARRPAAPRRSRRSPPGAAVSHSRRATSTGAPYSSSPSADRLAGRQADAHRRVRGGAGGRALHVHGAAHRGARRPRRPPSARRRRRAPRGRRARPPPRAGPRSAARRAAAAPSSPAPRSRAAAPARSAISSVTKGPSTPPASSAARAGRVTPADEAAAQRFTPADDAAGRGRADPARHHRSRAPFTNGGRPTP